MTNSMASTGAANGTPHPAEIRLARPRRQGPIRSHRPGQLDEVTSRTQQGHFFLRPSDAVNDMILGCVGRAQELYPVRLHGFIFMSNHYHVLASADDAKQLSSFVGFVNGNVARKLNALNGWSGRVWQRRFRAIAVHRDDATQLDRLRYMLAHGV